MQIECLAIIQNEIKSSMTCLVVEEVFFSTSVVLHPYIGDHHGAQAEATR